MSIYSTRFRTPEGSTAPAFGKVNCVREHDIWKGECEDESE